MPRRPTRIWTLFLLLACLFPVAAQPPGGDDWKYDVVQRHKGIPLSGLVVSQDRERVRIHCILRKPGKPTVVFTEVLPAREVARVVLAPAAEREKLKQRLETLKRDRLVLSAHLRSLDPGAKGPRPADDLLPLDTVPWPGDPRQKARAYRSAHFRLVSNARREVVVLAAVHLEQVYNAYARALPPRTTRATPTTILLTRSLGDYRAIARERGLNLFNLAFFDPARNQVVCGSDLERLRDELEKIRAQHARLRQEIKERRADLTRIYRGKPPAELLAPLAAGEQRLFLSDKRNNEAFVRQQQLLFQRLYHEAFHAYLDAFVYPSSEGSLPRWFNEGLAQIFETAIVEVGEMRVGHPDPERLAAVRKALDKGEFLPLATLLRSEPRDFLVAHVGARQASDRHYLASWALAFYLTFERRLVGTPALDTYVASLHKGTDPLDAFTTLVNENLADFDRAFRRYLRVLRSDGTTPRDKGKG